MKCFSLRAIRPFRRAASHREQIGLATLDTALKPACAPRSQTVRSRAALMPLLSCALLGMTATASLANETTGQPAETASTVAPAKPAADVQPAVVTTVATSGRLIRTARLRGTVKRTLATQDAAKPEEKKEEKKAEEAPAGPKPGDVSLSGLVDWYYGVNARAPHTPSFLGFAEGGGMKLDNSIYRFFDINDREPSFSLGELNITRTAGKGFPLGVTATLAIGDSARLFQATEPGGTSAWYPILNLFLTKNFTFLKHDVAVDFGKFVTPIGYEVLESSSNDNYSRAFDFWYGVPFYHMGLRATTNLTPTLTMQAGVVNGWNDTADSNDAKSIYTQLTWKPNSRFTQIFSYIGGLEGAGAGYFDNTTAILGNGVTLNLFDSVTTYQLTPKTKIAGWVDYGSATGSYQTALGPNRISGNWLGLVAYVRHQFTPHFAVAGRLEQFEDMTAPGTTSPRLLATGYQKLREATLTLEYTALKDHLISRLEYRHDHASSSLFGAGGGFSPDQDTIYFSQVYKF